MLQRETLACGTHQRHLVLQGSATGAGEGLACQGTPLCNEREIACKRALPCTKTEYVKSNCVEDSRTCFCAVRVQWPAVLARSSGQPAHSTLHAPQSVCCNLESCSCARFSLLIIFRLSQRSPQCHLSPAALAQQGCLVPAGEPCLAQERSGRWPQAAEGNSCCGWEKCSAQPRGRCPGHTFFTTRTTRGHKPLPSTRCLGAEGEVPKAGPSRRDVGCHSASGLTSYL